MIFYEISTKYAMILNRKELEFLKEEYNLVEVRLLILERKWIHWVPTFHFSISIHVLYLIKKKILQ